MTTPNPDIFASCIIEFGNERCEDEKAVTEAYGQFIEECLQHEWKESVSKRMLHRGSIIYAISCEQHVAAI